MSAPKPLCDCGNGKPVYCKGVCNPCYRRAKLATKPLCDCGSGKPIYCKGLCQPCYYRVCYEANKPLCDCGNGKPVYAKGLCNPCYHRAYREAHHEKYLAHKKAWREVNREKHRAASRVASKAWKEANREKVRAAKKAWYEANPEKARARVLAWAKENPDKTRVINQRRRARLLAADDGFTHDEWQEVLETYSYRCAYCSAEGPMTMDHVVPLSKGGRHHRSNIVPACKPCNSKKHTRSAEEYRAELLAEAVGE